MGIIKLILRLFGSWELWVTAGVLLGIFSLVSQITAFEKRPSHYYKGPVVFVDNGIKKRKGKV